MNINARLPEAGRAVKIFWLRPLSARGQLPCGPAAMAPCGLQSRVCGRNSGPSRLMHLLSEPDRRGENKAGGRRPRHCRQGKYPLAGLTHRTPGDGTLARRTIRRLQSNLLLVRAQAQKVLKGILIAGGVWHRPQSHLPPWRVERPSGKGVVGVQKSRRCAARVSAVNRRVDFQA
jgi:hypothetical protein